MRVRWIILMFLLWFTIAAYVQRTAVGVAAAPMMPALGLTQLQIGLLETAFLVSYTLFQFPGGLIGQWLGARHMLAGCGLVSVMATLALPLLPSVLAGRALFGGLLAAQFMLGLAQAPLFALVSGALERWFPPRQWALAQGITSGGIGLGGAAAPVLIAVLMVAHGWRAALVITSLPVLILVVGWWLYGRDEPGRHPAVTREELAELPPTVAAPPALRAEQAAALLLDWNLMGLSLSYLAMNVVFYLITFWSFLYLVQARHFALLQGGLATAIPLLGGAAGALIGGAAGGALRARLGPRRGLRVVPLISLPATCGLLLLGVQAGSPVVALGALTLAFLLLETNEACFWTASMEIAGVDTAAAGGILNTGGNLGGIIATPVVALLSGSGHWTAPFVLAAAAALLSAALWLTIDPGGATRHR